jgi:hypothetical protein
MKCVLDAVASSMRLSAVALPSGAVVASAASVLRTLAQVVVKLSDCSNRFTPASINPTRDKDTYGMSTVSPARRAALKSETAGRRLVSAPTYTAVNISDSDEATPAVNNVEPASLITARRLLE